MFKPVKFAFRLALDITAQLSGPGSRDAAELLLCGVYGACFGRDRAAAALRVVGIETDRWNTLPSDMTAGSVQNAWREARHAVSAAIWARRIARRAGRKMCDEDLAVARQVLRQIHSGEKLSLFERARARRVA